MRAKVTVIIPAYNEEQTIQRCINSLFEQTVKPNIIIVNDGSTDNTLKILKKYEQYDNILIINQSNQGVSTARNRGIRAAMTQFITFVDADDYVEKDFIQVLLNGYLQSSRVDLSICNYSMKTLVNKTILYGNFSTSIINRQDYFKSVIDDNGVNGFIYNKLFKKEIIDKYHILFDPDIAIGEDFLFCFKYGIYCNSVALNDSVEIHYIPTERGVSSTMQIRGRFSAKIFDYFEANLKIMQILLDQEDKNLQMIINKQICRTAVAATTIIRKVYLYHKREYLNKIIRLRKFLKTNLMVILVSKYLRIGDKLKVILAVFTPRLLNKYDQLKNNR